MKLISYKKSSNKEEYIKEKNIIVKRGFYSDIDGDFSVTFFKDKKSTLNNNIYSYHLYDDNSNTRRFLKLNWFKNLLFTYLQGNGFFQNKENVLWLTNIIMLLLSLFN